MIHSGDALEHSSHGDCYLIWLFDSGAGPELYDGWRDHAGL